MSLSEKIQQINREISATVESALSDLRREVAERVRASSEEIARHVEELSPRLPASFLAHEDLSPFTEQMAREAAESAAREAREAAQAAAGEASRSALRSGVAEVRDALAGIDRARSQAEILAALLRETAERFGVRAAVLLVRGTEMRGWAGQGFGEMDGAIRDLSFTPSADGGWSRLGQGQSAIHLSAADCADLCSRIEAPLPHEGVLIPLVLRDRVAAGLYADRTDGLPPLESLQVLAYVAAQSIELLPFRERPFTPTLAAEEGLAFSPAAALPEPAPAPEPAPEPAAETYSTTRTEVAPEPEPQIHTEPQIEPEIEPQIEPEIEIEAEPEPAEGLVEAASPWAPAPPSETEALTELPAFEEEEEIAPAPEPSPAATVFQPIPREVLQTVEQPQTAAAIAAAQKTTPMPIPQTAESSPDETVLLQRPNLREVPAPPPPAPTPLRPVPAPPPPPPTPAATEPASQEASLAGIPEVKPPSGVEGPGWAFATSRVAVSPTEEAQHEEARRLARLLVSEIKLYNEEQVEEGRRRKDVYERLKEDIDRSRQMYEERVEPRILKSTDYFYQELVRILAAGDAKALGI
jgi:hypothetical protein